MKDQKVKDIPIDQWERTLSTIASISSLPVENLLRAGIGIDGLQLHSHNAFVTIMRYIYYETVGRQRYWSFNGRLIGKRSIVFAEEHPRAVGYCLCRRRE